jgi:N-acetylmuramoyl-L-alanine amidase
MHADLFISIHADASPSNDAARGATIYTLSEVASDREAALLAEQQNAPTGSAARR